MMRRNDRVTLVLAIVLALCACAIAAAQDDVQVPEAGVEQPDSEATPKPRGWTSDGSRRWSQVGGLVHPNVLEEPEPTMVTDSPTPYTVDLHAVDFLNSREGLA